MLPSFDGWEALAPILVPPQVLEPLLAASSVSLAYLDYNKSRAHLNFLASSIYFTVQCIAWFSGLMRNFDARQHSFRTATPRTDSIRVWHLRADLCSGVLHSTAPSEP
jgi:hypothetical protein